MISAEGRHWATGITVYEIPDRHAWYGEVAFHDDGFLGDDKPDTGEISTEGVLRNRNPIRDGDQVTALRAVVEALKADAERLGIVFAGPMGAAPSIHYRGDGEWKDYPPPPGWRALLAAEAGRLGWRAPYTLIEEQR